MEHLMIRTLKDPAELAKIPALERAIWGNDDPLPVSWLRVLTDLGGEVSVAYLDQRPEKFLGFTMSIGSYDHRGRLLYSHQAGVLPEWQGHGIGRLLKYHQSRWAEQAGYRRILWTFDPLRTLNAYFNIGILGAEPISYHPDYYGPLTSALNQGLPTDRILCEWRVPAPMPRRRPERVCFKIYIPQDMGLLKREEPEQALRWRETVKNQFLDALNAGYRVVGFSIAPSPAYLLSN